MRLPNVAEGRSALHRRGADGGAKELRAYNWPQAMRRRRHHLPEKVFFEGPLFVSLTLCTDNRRPIFADVEIASSLVDVLRNLHREEWMVYAFSVMPDHVHIVLKNQGRPVGDFVQALKAVTTRRIRSQGWLGDVWQRGYYDHIIRRAEGLLRTVRYVLMNPVRKGLVEEWASWPYSGSVVWPQLDEGLLSDREIENTVWADLDPRC